MIPTTLAIVVIVLTRAFNDAEQETADDLSRALQDAKVAEYRERRKLELDWGTGKLSHGDYRISRRQLRHETARLPGRSTPGAEKPPATNDAPA